jgi:hypothetical protein
MISIAQCCEGFPVIVENHGLAEFLLIPSLLSSLVVCCGGFLLLANLIRNAHTSADYLAMILARTAKWVAA